MSKKSRQTAPTLEWCRIQERDFSLEEEINHVKQVSKRIGSIVTFIGTARDFSNGKKILHIEIEYYPGMAEKRLNEIQEKALSDFDIIGVSIVHRVGHINIGENIVLIAVAAQHRKDAFKACEWCIGVSS
jgi:molybdopterin synthase catalytic subunit